MTSPRRDFFVVYDYGMGGVWAIINATDEEQILARYPELAVVESRPAWMNDMTFDRIWRTERHYIDDPLRGFIKALIDRRAS